jgi:hypothetical protein
MLGVPFYGKNSNGTGYTYREIVALYKPDREVDFVGGIGFNGVATIRDKTAYTLNHGYRGIMIWEITQDTNDESSLLKAISDTILTSLPTNLDRTGTVDFHDFRILASAWRSEPNDSNWDPLCDISLLHESGVNGCDLAFFCRDWLISR